MYKSLKKWLNIPVQLLPFIKYDGAGDKEYGQAVDTKCYIEGKVTKVVNAAGNEVISQRQFYFDGSESIKVSDALIFEGKEQLIQAISPFYDKGVIDIWVVYT